MPSKLRRIGPAVAVLIVVRCSSSPNGNATGTTTTSINSTSTIAPKRSAAQGAPTSTTTATAGPTTSPTLAPVTDDTRCTTSVSSRADFDPRSGQYAVYLYGADPPRRTVSFDVVQFLGGNDAINAYHKDNPSDPGGPPNDYYVVNAVKRIDQATVAANPRVVVLDPNRLPYPTQGTFDQLPRVTTAGSGLFWLTFQGSVVTDICQQYTP